MSLSLSLLSSLSLSLSLLLLLSLLLVVIVIVHKNNGHWLLLLSLSLLLVYAIRVVIVVVVILVISNYHCCCQSFSISQSLLLWLHPRVLACVPMSGYLFVCLRLLATFHSVVGCCRLVIIVVFGYHQLIRHVDDWLLDANSMGQKQTERRTKYG